MIIKNAESGEKGGMEAGVHDALCYSVIDMGTTEGKFGKKRQLLIGWKLIDKFYKDSTDMVRYSQFYTASLNPKSNFRKLIQGWFMEEAQSGVLDKEFNTRWMLNKACKLVVSPNQNGKNLITQALPLKSDITIENTEYFNLDEYEGGALPEFISEGIGKLIKQSDEYIEKNNSSSTNEPIIEAEYDDDIPF